MNDLLINGKDALSNWGVHMGQGFLNTLLAPLELKDYVTNEVRDEDGIRVLNSTPSVKNRNVTLSFVIIGTTQADLMNKRNAFLAEIYKGRVTIQVPAVSDDTYKLHYKGQSASWNMNKARTIASLSLSFTESNPTDR